MPRINKEVEEVVVPETRDLATRKADSYGNYEVYRQGGGVVPESLAGLYTTPTKAQQVVDHHYIVQGFEDEAKKIKEEMRSIKVLDQISYDD